MSAKKRRTAKQPLTAASPDPETADRITRSLIHQVAAIAQGCGAAAIFVYADAVDEPLPVPADLEARIVYVTKTEDEDAEQEELGTDTLRVPNVPLDRMGQLKLAVFLALSKGIIQRDDTIVCLAGPPASGCLDTTLVTQVGRESEIYSLVRDEDGIPPGTLPDVVERIVSVASALGSEGREGKPVGALFVIGDMEHVLPLTRQLIINPFRGYEDHERNILDPALEETIKELSSLDGAFLIRGDGIVETCGALLRTSASQEEYELPQGLGARHHAAAGITAVTESLAVTVSESTGTVTIFRGGRIVTEIERPRSALSRQT